MSNREQLQLAHTSTAALRQVILFPDRRTTLASFFRRRRLFRHCCSAYVASGPGSLLLRSGPSYGDMTFLRRMEARAYRVLGLVDCVFELFEVELSARAVLFNDMVQIVFHARHVHMLEHIVLHQHHRDQAHGLCACAAAWHAVSISTGEYGRGSQHAQITFEARVSVGACSLGLRIGRARETVHGERAAAVKVGHVENVLERRPFVHVAVQLSKLVRVDRHVPVRGVREVVELQRLCAAGAAQLSSNCSFCTWNPSRARGLAQRGGAHARGVLGRFARPPSMRDAAPRARCLVPVRTGCVGGRGPVRPEATS